jgi:4-amino-4-deoxy-L-arabinose transferase-like glycosyltransferase
MVRRLSERDMTMALVSGSSKRGRSGLGFGALVDFATRSHKHAVATLLLVSLIAFLPGFFYIPPVDRDEARFAQATKQMIETGDYVDIRFQEVSRYKKPVGIYWLQAAAVKAGEAAGVPRALTRIWLYRIPSLLGAIAAVLLAYWAALAFVAPRAALLAGFMMASSMMLGIEARIATTDAVLLAATTAAMGALGRTYLAAREESAEARSLAVPAIFWTAVAAGLLIKGPLILLFVALSAGILAVLDRSARFLLRLKPLPGIAWMLLLVLPWFVAIVARSGTAFFSDSLGGDFLAKVGGAQEMHWGPPGYYLALFWLMFFPAAMLAPLAAGAVWRWRNEPSVRFLLAWIVPSWIVFELAMTKLPHYVLPLYPAIAILIACAIDRNALTQTRWLKRATVWWLVIATAAAIAAVAVNIAIGQRPGFAAWPLAAGGVIAALFAWWLYDVDGPETSLLRAVAAAILVYAALFGATFPAIPALFPSAQVARQLYPPLCANPAFVTAGHYEASLVFLLGTDMLHASGSGAADFLRGGPCRFALVEKGQERAFVARADAIGLRYALGPRIEGYNVATGRPIEITIFMGRES